MNNVASLLIFFLSAICCVLLTKQSNDALLDICLITASVIFIILTVSAVIALVEENRHRDTDTDMLKNL